MKVEIDNRQSIRLPLKTLERVLATRLEKKFGCGTVHILITDDDKIRELHRVHLDDDTPTDVLSFPLEPLPGTADEEEVLAQIVCSADTARREAKKRKRPARDELILYIVHGLLHLIGYDDHDPADRRRMRAAERRTIAALCLP